MPKETPADAFAYNSVDYVVTEQVVHGVTRGVGIVFGKSMSPSNFVTKLKLMPLSVTSERRPMSPISCYASIHPTSLRAFGWQAGLV